MAKKQGLEVVLIQDLPPVHCIESNVWFNLTMTFLGDFSPQAVIMLKNTLSFSSCGFEDALVCSVIVEF